VLEATMRFQNCTIRENKLSTSNVDPVASPGFVMILSTVYSDNNTFSMTESGVGGFISASSSSSFQDTSSKFSQSSCTGSGGIVYAVNSDLTFSKSTISDSYAPTGGAFSLINQSSIKLTSVSVSNVNALNRGPAIIYS
jgi:hypothetical protein